MNQITNYSNERTVHVNPSLKKLLFLRYKPLLIFLSILVLGIYCFQTVNGITAWKNNYQYFQSNDAIKDFEKQIEESYEFDDANGGQIFLYYNLKKEQAVYTSDFNKYKDYSLTVFNSKLDANQQAYNSYAYYNEHFLIFLIVFVTSGVLLFLYDLKSNFTSALFSSKFKRSDIYRQKILLVGGVLAGSLFVGKIFSFICYHLLIPNHFFNISIKQHLLSTLSGWATLVSIFLLSSLIGILFGDWLFGIGTIIVLFFTFSSFLSNIDLVYTTLFVDESKLPYTVSETALNQVMPLNQTSTLKLNIVPLVFLILAGIFAYFLGKYLFNRISLEHSGDVILVPQISRIFQICMILYIMIVVSTPTIVITFFPAEALDTYEIALNILIIAVTFIGVFLLSEFLLFNKKSKIINRLNFFA